MCGIFGAATNEKLDHETLDKLQALGLFLQHRGPDSNSNFTENNFLMGFNRLAIVDTKNGIQPFFNNDKEIIVTCNGQIYNYLQLREELINLGIKFKTDCDIEVLPHLYEIYGDQFVSKLRGMFAIAIVDKRANEIKFFVDRLGEKPLYWTIENGIFFYSSEVVPLLKSKISKMCIDLNQVSTYLKYGFVLDPYTIIKDVYRVTPGTFMTVRLDDLSLNQTKYWDVFLNLESLSNPVTALNHNFRNIAKTICQGDAKIGLALSGGFDSRLVAELSISSGVELQAITIGYAEKTRHDEVLAASNAAKRLGLKISVRKISSDEAAKSLREVCALIDEPVADISSIGYLVLFSAARDLDIRVLLMGHGADELIMSYPWLNKALERAVVRTSTLSSGLNLVSYIRILENLFQILRSKSIPRIYESLRENIFTLRQVLVDYRDIKSGVKDIDFYSLSPTTIKRTKLANKLQTNVKLVESNQIKSWVPHSSQQLTKIAQSALIKGYLRLNGLLQIDKLSMSRSIEVRNPLVDFELVETILRSNWDSKNIPSKALLKAANEMPVSEVLAKEFKRGFSPPTRVWYRALMSTYRAELSSPRSVEIGIFPKEWGRYFKRPFSKVIFKSPIWFELVMFEIWIRETEEKVGERFSATN